MRPEPQVTEKEMCTFSHQLPYVKEKNGQHTTQQQPLEICGLIIYMDSMPLRPFWRRRRKKKKEEIRKFQWQRAVGWISGSSSANCVFLLTFNSPKHPCFTAPWAIAFLNLSLERQELWSLSIEEKGMLFPCHLLVAPPSSLPWSTVQHPPYTFPLPHFASS